MCVCVVVLVCVVCVCVVVVVVVVFGLEFVHSAPSTAKNLWQVWRGITEVQPQIRGGEPSVMLAPKTLPPGTSLPEFREVLFLEVCVEGCLGG